MTNPNSETIESRLQQRLAERMESVRELIAARTQLNTARTTLDEAEQADAAAWQTALDAGWTVNELKQSGLPEPTVKKTRNRRIKPRPQAVTDQRTTPTNFDGTNEPVQNGGA